MDPRQEELTKFLAQELPTLSVTVVGTVVTLKDSEKEILSIAGTSSEDACAKMLELLVDAFICAKLSLQFGDALAGIIIVKH
jgi:hypothetical protein